MWLESGSGVAVLNAGFWEQQTCPWWKHNLVWLTVCCVLCLNSRLQQRGLSCQCLVTAQPTMCALGCRVSISNPYSYLCHAMVIQTDRVKCLGRHVQINSIQSVQLCFLVELHVISVTALKPKGKSCGEAQVPTC